MNHSTRWIVLLPALAFLLTGCPRPHPASTCSGDDCPRGFRCDESLRICVGDGSDAGLLPGDASQDASAVDVESTDRSPAERTGHESGRPDAAQPDAAAPDTAQPDTAVPEAGNTEAGSSEAGISDSSTSDAALSWGGGCNHTFRIPITVSRALSDGPLEDFPLLVRGAFPEATAAGAGSDFVFTDSDGMTRLPHELERIQSGEGGLVAWVRVPLLSGSAPHTLYLYFDAPAGTPTVAASEVWPEPFRGVWHLASSPANSTGDQPQARDSTGYQHHGVPQGSQLASGLQPAQIGDGWVFDGINDRVRIAYTPALAFADTLTVSAWYNADATGNNYLVSNGAGEGARGWDLSFDDEPSDTSSHYQMFRSALGASGPLVYTSSWTLHPIGQWTQLVGVFDSQSCARFYVDGVLDNAICDGDMPAPLHVSALDLVLGARSDTTGFFRGVVDEVRVEATARSADWIKACHLNQAEASLVQLGEKEANPLSCE